MGQTIKHFKDKGWKLLMKKTSETSDVGSMQIFFFTTLVKYLDSKTLNTLKRDNK